MLHHNIQNMCDWWSVWRVWKNHYTTIETVPYQTKTTGAVSWSLYSPYHPNNYMLYLPCSHFFVWLILRCGRYSQGGESKWACANELHLYKQTARWCNYITYIRSRLADQVDSSNQVHTSVMKWSTEERQWTVYMLRLLCVRGVELIRYVWQVCGWTAFMIHTLCTGAWLKPDNVEFIRYRMFSSVITQLNNKVWSKT